MKIGLVGFAGSGKTTVFNTLTGLDVPVGFGGEVHLGTVKVPDRRIDTLSSGIFKPKKTIYAEIVFSDIPGEHGAEKQGLSKKSLQQIRDQDVLCLVLRAFPNPALEAPADPAAELDAFLTECLLADLTMVERRLDRAKKDKPDPQELAAFELMQATLEQELPLRSLSAQALDRSRLSGYGFLTDRPLMVVVNRSEDEAAVPLPDAMAKRLRRDPRGRPGALGQRGSRDRQDGRGRPGGVPGRPRAQGVGAGAVHPHRLRAARPHLVLHGGARRGARLARSGAAATRARRRAGSTPTWSAASSARR